MIGELLMFRYMAKKRRSDGATEGDRRGSTEGDRRGSTEGDRRGSTKGDVDSGLSLRRFVARTA